MRRLPHLTRVNVAVLFTICFALVASIARGGPLESNRPLRIGVLASLTGSWSTLGQNTVAALQLAIERLEVDASRKSDARVRLFVRDTKLDPALALAAIKDLDKHGVNVVIGPQSSSELAAVKAYADQHDILVISQGSTASSLAIANDNLFRMCPNDRREAAAIAALMWRDGIRTLVPLWRNDAGNNGLHDSVQQVFQSMGGVVTAGFRYEPTTTAFTSAVAAASAQVAAAQVATPSSVAVYLAAFDEVVGVFRAAQTDATLTAATWYGSDGVALSQPLLQDSEAAAFAVGAEYPNPIFGLDDALESRWGPVAAAVKARSGIDADAFALSAYDALFVVVRAHQATNRRGGFAAFKSAFVAAANAYDGVTGSTALDPAGDRVSADFDFWAVRPDAGGYRWVRVGRYVDGVLF